MTKEDIINAGIEYTVGTRPMCICGDAFDELGRQLNRSLPFEAGAEYGSTEQKKIDIEKACTVIHNMMVDGYEFSLSENDYIIEAFRNAMNE